MAFTRVVGPGIHTEANINSHNIKSTGIITATKFDGPFDSINVSGAATFTGNVTIGGTLTYEDVTNIDSVGLITARKGIISSGVVTATAFHGASQVGIQSGGVQIGAGITQLNFVGTGNTFAVNGTTVDISIQGGGGGGGGAFTTSVTGVQTSSVIVGVGTTTTDDADLQGIGNTAKGLYISNGMMIMDNSIHGNHYIGTNFNGLMVGPVNVNGTIFIDGNYVVV
jgi:hypothetical protein|tara:strand:- start:394 stop:1068 length:675 start_codon:yes stop_codon:yes gene_type:complete